MTDILRKAARGVAIFSGAVLFSGCATLDQNHSSQDHVAQLMARGKQEFSQGKLERAFETFTQVIQITPDRAEAWNARGFVSSSQGHLLQAAREFSEAIQRDQANPVSHNNLDVAYLESGDAGSALTALNEAVRWSPQSALALNHGGWRIGVSDTWTRP